MKTNTTIYRQGDVLVRAVTVIPAGAQPAKPDGNRVVLAYGEVTGHAHAIDVAEAREFTMVEAGNVTRRFLEVIGKNPPNPARILSRETGLSGDQLVLDTAIGPVKFAAADTIEDGVIATPKQDWAPLRHEEHLAQGVLNGLYEITQQREYSPEEIRSVAD